MKFHAWIPAPYLVKLRKALENVGLETKRQFRTPGYAIRQCSYEYLKLLRGNILKEAFAGSYGSYSKKYDEWKQESGPLGYPAWWMLTGDLVTSLTFWKGAQSGSVARWHSGIPAGKSGGSSPWSKGRRPIALYARALEEGLGRQPKRPVFAPTLQQFLPIATLICQKSLQKVGSQWK